MKVQIVCSALAVLLAAAAVSANPVANGTYRLHNHPDGNQLPPPYGLRIDELYNPTTGHDVFTFDFDAVGSSVFMDVTNTTIHIYGTALGGRDNGSGYFADVYNTFYTFDFLYNVGVGMVPGDDDRQVDGPNHSNFGFITRLAGPTTQLTDERGGNPNSFRLGDEDNDLGHRGYNGISGWGWLSIPVAGAPVRHVESMDWLFTAQLIPTPGTAALAGLGLLAAGRRRR